MPIGTYSSIIAAASLIGGAPLSMQAPAWIDLSPSDMIAESAAVAGTAPTHRPLAASTGRFTRAALTPPTAEQALSLMISYAPRKTRARFELGALGGGRVDAPGLVHLDLGMNF